MKHALALVSAMLIVSMSGNALAQTTSTPEDRPATLSVWGDTGAWFIPSAEVLPSGRWAFSLARTESDFGQGFTDVSSWPLSVAAGIGRAELFGSWRVVTRIDRDTTPLFFSAVDNEPGGVVNEFPANRTSWSGNQIGDLLLGGKTSLLSQRSGLPLALAVRGTVKIPTADEEEGVGSGKTDWYLDAVAGSDIGNEVDLSGFVGYAWRGDPDLFDLADSTRWGVGASFPSRARVRMNIEFQGEWVSDSNVVTAPNTLVGDDGTVAPVFSNTENPMNVSLGLTVQGFGGLFFDASVVYAFNADRAHFFPQRAVRDIDDDPGDAIGIQFKIGWHGGVRTYVPPPPPVAAVPAPLPPANQLPAVLAQCNPCTVEAGSQVAIRATGQDPDGDALRYEWSSPAGTIADRSAASSIFNAPDVPGPVLLTVTADDGRGGVATDTVTVNVTQRPVGTVGTLQGIRFDDVYFNFDDDTLRPDSMLTLGRVLNALRGDPTMRLQIEGHACDLGTPEYNLGLSERRAERVRQYFITQGIDPGRLTTVAYGEERPQNDNSTEALRRLNRRAVMNATTGR